MKCHVVAALCLVAVIASVTADTAQHVQGVQQGEQQFQRPQQQLPIRPLPYRPQIRRQSAMGRMRDSVYSFFSGLMSAGRQFRQQASARIFNMLNRRSINRRSQRQQRPIQPANYKVAAPSRQQ